MKILIVGSNDVWAFENHFIKHLRELGVFVDSFPAHDVFYTYYYGSLYRKFLFKLGISRIYRRINTELLNISNSKQYDIIWVFKGMEILPETLDIIKNNGPKLVNFNPDHPFIHSFKGSGNSNVTKSIDRYDLHLCYNLEVKKRIENEYNIQCEWLPFGYEKTEIKIPAENEEILRSCFIGNPDNYRAEILSKIATNGIPLDLYGNGWDNWIKPQPGVDIRFFPAIYKDEFNKIAPKYRVQLNIFRPHNNNSHNMRTFEMPGLGCIMLAPESNEHSLFFIANKEAFFYSINDEMISKTKMILGFKYQKALEIRKNAIARCLSSKYDYKNRAKEIVQFFKILIYQ